jgi:hypothetical protein
MQSGQVWLLSTYKKTVRFDFSTIVLLYKIVSYRLEIPGAFHFLHAVICGGPIAN